MVAPFDYTSAFGQQQAGPLGGFVQGLRLGGAVQEMEAQRAQQEAQTLLTQQKAAAEQAALQRQQQIGNAMSALLAKPNRTFDDYEAVAALLPEKEAGSLRASFEARTKEQQRADLSFSTQVMAAFDAGAKDVGLRLLRERAEAERNAGRPDQAQAYETFASISEINPDSAGVTIGALVAKLPGGKDAIESFNKLREERRAAALAPFKLRQETADAIIKEADAKLAPERFLANLNLTKEQINQAKAAQAASRAAAAASGAEARRKNAEAEQMAAGVIPLDKRPDKEREFRKEYTDLTKGYQEVKSAYGRVLSSQDNAVGDLSLIFGYMKMLDPGSVVREGEFATAQNAAGVPERIQNIYNRALSGERLTEGQRKAFKGQAESLFKQAGQQESTVRKGIERIAKGYGLNTANIFLEAVESAPTAPPGPPPPAPIPTVGTPQSMGGAMPGVPGPEMPTGFRVIRR